MQTAIGVPNTSTTAKAPKKSASPFVDTANRAATASSGTKIALRIAQPSNPAVRGSSLMRRPRLPRGPWRGRRAVGRP